MIFINRKGIATETIFYIVIGIVVVGILSVLVYNYSANAKQTGSCTQVKAVYCEQYNTCVAGGATAATCDGKKTDFWTAAKAQVGGGTTSTCGDAPTTAGC